MTLKIRFLEYKCHYENIVPLTDYNVVFYSAQRKFFFGWMNIYSFTFTGNRTKRILSYEQTKDALLRKILRENFRHEKSPIRVEEYPTIQIFQNIFF